jgi:hypothetical protein
LLTGADGQSRISTEDYAIAFVNELERPPHARERFTVGYSAESGKRPYGFGADRSRVRGRPQKHNPGVSDGKEAASTTDRRRRHPTHMNA